MTWTDAGSCRKPPASDADLIGEGGAEQEVLATRRQDLEHATDVADEAHVEHPVGLVEDEDLDVREVDGALADMVEQAPGGGDDHVRAVAQRADLRREADAAVDGGGADAPVASVDADALLDLERELAGRGEDEGADRRGGSASGWPSRWSIGSTNAAVLPVPVWAPAMRSRPASTSGMASAWTGVASV